MPRIPSYVGLALAVALTVAACAPAVTPAATPALPDGSERTLPPSAAILGDGFAASLPAPGGTMTPTPSSYDDVTPRDGYHVVLLRQGCAFSAAKAQAAVRAGVAAVRGGLTGFVVEV
ncbi:hypothetical protein [Xylanimonas protaetiae]|uniref:PA domain-containing protein n=1 Tax=Xylanimonas protaetiae TaxID=2509457 RepID=A0A4P6FGC9_9MICO|nr:hypothetical protein [Xylanimonas protaetiae]QAY69648.1 hypothetical protein ET471_06005 [Xylanimonas protaetiae]